MNTARPNQVDNCAELFFRRSEAGDWDGMLALAAPGMTAWQSGGEPRQAFVDVVPGFAAMRKRMGPWKYSDVERIVGEDGFCEQHVVRFNRPDGQVREFAACVVATVDEHGLITRLDEYLDPSRESTWKH